MTTGKNQELHGAASSSQLSLIAGPNLVRRFQAIRNCGFINDFAGASLELLGAYSEKGVKRSAKRARLQYYTLMFNTLDEFLKEVDRVVPEQALKAK